MVNVKSLCNGFARKEKKKYMMCGISQPERRMLRSEYTNYGNILDFDSYRFSDKSSELPLEKKC